MRDLFCISLLFGLFSATLLNGQQAVPQRVRYERVWAVVPMVGAGTWEDPRRPMFAPKAEDRSQGRIRRTPEEMKPTKHGEQGQLPIMSFHYQVSDDGRSALVEFIGRDEKALREILEYKGAGVKVFRRGRAKKADVLEEFKRQKKDFDWQKFLGVE